MRFILPLLLLVTLPGCPDRMTCRRDVRQGTQSPIEWGVVDQPVFIPLTATDVGCDESEVTSAEVEVFDPTNSVIDAQTRVDADGTEFLPTATVTFTPTQPGLHHLVVTFRPAGGRVQHDVLVAADGTKDERVVLPSVCRWVQKMGDDFVCNTHVYSRDGGVRMTLPSDVVAIANADTLWTVADGGVWRMQTDGGVFVSALPSALTSGGQLLASDRDVFVTSGLASSAVPTAALVVADPPQVTELAEWTPSVAFRQGDVLGLVEAREDAGFQSKMCTRSIVGASIIEGGCTPGVGTSVAGGERNAFWTFVQSNGALAYVSLTDAGMFQASPSILLPRAFESKHEVLGGPFPRFGGPILERVVFRAPDATGISHYFVARRHGGDVQLVHYDTWPVSNDGITWVNAATTCDVFLDP